MYKKIIAGLGIGALLLQGGYVIGQTQNKDDVQNSVVIEELQNQLAETEAELAQVNLQLAQQGVDLNETKEKLNIANQNIATLTAEKDELGTQITELETELETNKNLTQEQKTQYEAQLSELQSQYNSKVAELETITAEKIALETTLAETQGVIKQLEKELTELTIASGKTSASYFTFEGSMITGYHGPEELKDIVLPTHYSLGGMITRTAEAPFNASHQVPSYLYDNNLSMNSFILTFSNGQSFAFSDISDFLNRQSEVDPLFIDQQLTCVLAWEEQGYTDGYDYRVDRIQERALLGAEFESLTIPDGFNLSYHALFNCYANKLIIADSVVPPVLNNSLSIGGIFDEVECNISSRISNDYSISIINGVLTIDSNASQSIFDSGLCSVASFVTDINWDACESDIGLFYNNSFAFSNLASLVLPFEHVEIGSQAFYQCLRLSTVDLRNATDVCSIGEFAFQHCYQLKTVYLPSEVIGLSESAFDYCFSLEKIYVPSGTLEYYRELCPTYADLFEELSE